MTRVEAPSRLHFGLLAVPRSSAQSNERSFGGVGLMIDRPGVGVTVTPSEDWSAEGPYSARALTYAQTFVASLPGNVPCAFRIHVEHCPPEHTGLGTGTSLGLAVAKALAVELGHADWNASELANRVGRGARSAIGIHGFERGGFIVEGGKLPGEAVAPLVGRWSFPDDWRVLLIQPSGLSTWHGDRERSAFARTEINNDTPTLCRLVLMGLLPALSTKDFVNFSEALHEFNLRAGEAFAIEQGGPYSSPTAVGIVGFLRQRGVRGVGQTSWGPTIFAVVEHERSAVQLKEMIATACPVALDEIRIVKAAVAGATCQSW